MSGRREPDGHSKVLRFADFNWPGIEKKRYKDGSGPWKGVVRHVLVGEGGEETPFQVRYFEVEPGGYTTLEHHGHRHAVIVMRGHGSVRLGERTEPIEFGDVVYVAPHEPHQFRAGDEEKLGFLCVVAAERDRPRAVSAENDHDQDKDKD